MKTICNDRIKIDFRFLMFFKKREDQINSYTRHGIKS